MQELTFDQVEQINGGSVASAIQKAAAFVTKYAPHPAVKVAAIVVGAGAAAYVGYEANRL